MSSHLRMVGYLTTACSLRSTGRKPTVDDIKKETEVVRNWYKTHTRLKKNPPKVLNLCVDA